VTAWDLVWSAHARRDMRGLETAVAQRIVSKLEQAAKNPQRAFTRLAGQDDYKLRVGDDRILVLLAHESRTILVQAVDHRKRVYRD
jgi:mRNA-degrading endonuclease RelE of RelBE toxin-antitoxin system